MQRATLALQLDDLVSCTLQVSLQGGSATTQSIPFASQNLQLLRCITLRGTGGACLYMKQYTNQVAAQLHMFEVYVCTHAPMHKLNRCRSLHCVFMQWSCSKSWQHSLTDYMIAFVTYKSCCAVPGLQESAAIWMR